MCLLIRIVSVFDFLNDFHSRPNIFLFIFCHADLTVFQKANVCATR